MNIDHLHTFLEVVATDTRSQIYQAMNWANEAAEEALAAMQQEASKAYDEPLGELLEQVRSISEAMAKLSDEARRALMREVSSLNAQNKQLNELIKHFGRLSKRLEANVQAAAKENQKAKRQWWQVAIMAVLVSTSVSTLITSAFWLIATR